MIYFWVTVGVISIIFIISMLSYYFGYYKGKNDGAEDILVSHYRENRERLIEIKKILGGKYDE